MPFHSFTILFVLFFFMSIAASSCGCLKVVQKSLSTDATDNDTQSVTTISPTEEVTVQTTVSIMEIPPTTEIIPNMTMQVESADPIIDYESYDTLHGARLNETTIYRPNESRAKYVPEFQKSYTLGCNATGFIADVKKGPMVIHFNVHPVINCNTDPSSCRGKGGLPAEDSEDSDYSDDSKESSEYSISTVNRPYFTMTVRDNETHAIIAQDGYAREFSSQTDDRTLMVYSRGRYHVTLEGCFVTVNLAITTGNSPVVNTTRVVESSDEDYDEEL